MMNTTENRNAGMRILLVIPALRYGGAERVIVSLANGFVREGRVVTLFVFQASDNPYTLDSRVHLIMGNKKLVKGNLLTSLYSLGKNALISYVRYAKIMREFKPSDVIAFLDNASILVILHKLLNRVQARVIVSERNDVTKNSRVKRLIKEKAFSKADAIVVQSKPMKDYYARKTSQSRKNIHIIGNPLNDDSIFKSTGAINRSRKKVVLAVGKLMDQKNFELLIESFALIHKSFPEYKLVIIGEGPDRFRLEKIIKQQRLQNSILLPGNVSKPFSRYGNSSIFAMTSIYEGFPNVLIEAVASGLPVVTTNFSPGTATELVRVNRNGFIVNSFKVVEFSEKLALALRQNWNENEINKIAISTREKYDLAIIIKKWIKIL